MIKLQYFIYIYIILIIIDNIETIKHYMHCLISSRTFSSIPLNKELINNVNNIIKNIKNYKNYTFIDFGSGYGNILYYFKDTFNKLIGIELNEGSFNESLYLLKNYKNISLLNMPMEDYIFPNTNIILYMYEPLFDVNCKNRMQVYNKVLNNLYKCNKKIYIIYVGSNTISNIFYNCFYNKKMFEEKFKLINKKNTSLWPFNRNIYILKN